jgi:hypothetical protein
MSRPPHDSMLDDEPFPQRINSRDIRQRNEHTLEPRQFGGGCAGEHAEAVLLGGPGGDVKRLAALRQQFKRVCRGFVDG